MVLLNSQISAFLMTGGSEASPVWSDIGVAFREVTQSMGEQVYSVLYLTNNGFPTTEVTGLDFAITFTGDYKIGDPVIDYIFAPEILYGTGEARKTKLKLVRSGKTIIWDVVMTKIKEQGGSAADPDAVLLELTASAPPQIS